MPLANRITKNRTATGKWSAPRSLVRVPNIMPPVIEGPGNALSRKPTCACGGKCPRCDVHHFQEGKSRTTSSNKTSCSPTWYGDTSPVIEETTGKFTGKLEVVYNDSAIRSPCVRECVEAHEGVHVRQLTPIVKRIHECDVAAAGDDKKEGECNALANKLLSPVDRFECEAYRKSFTCLTLKLLDSKSPCSKPPHSKEIQKHRKYEACEMKERCKAAGTPNMGTPVS